MGKCGRIAQKEAQEIGLKIIRKCFTQRQRRISRGKLHLDTYINPTFTKLWLLLTLIKSKSCITIRSEKKSERQTILRSVARKNLPPLPLITG